MLETEKQMAQFYLSFSDQNYQTQIANVLHCLKQSNYFYV